MNAEERNTSEIRILFLVWVARGMGMDSVNEFSCRYQVQLVTL
jgi:hypothetical protein